MMNDSILEVKGVTKRYIKSEFTLDNIQFSLEPGYIMGVVGRNGAGKTTLIKSILGVLPFETGEISVCGYDVNREPLRAKEHMGMVVDPPPFLAAKTLKENGELLGRLYDSWDEGAFKKYLATFSLHSDEIFANLSKGQKTRFQLAVALSHDTRLLVMDEPTSGLDPAFRRKFLEIVQTLVAERNLSVLFSTHITSDLDRVADYITMLDHGRQLFSLDKETLCERYQIVRCREDYRCDIPNGGVKRIHKTATGVETIFIDKAVEQQFLASHKEATTRIGSLEEVMYYLTEAEL